MRRLFIALLPQLLFGCDTAEPPSDLVGGWELVEVATYAGESVEGPIGSLLEFRADRGLVVRSGNECPEGRFGVTEQTPVGPLLGLQFGGCTELGVPPERDLSRFLHVLSYPSGEVPFGHGEYAFTFGIGESLPLQLAIDVAESQTRLVFRQVL